MLRRKLSNPLAIPRDFIRVNDTAPAAHWNLELLLDEGLNI